MKAKSFQWQLLETRCAIAWRDSAELREEFQLASRLLGYEKHAAMSGGPSALPATRPPAATNEYPYNIWPLYYHLIHIQS